MKLGPTATAEEALALCARLDPDAVPGGSPLISRMGAARVRDALPPLVAAVRGAGHPVVWACDPMHGNTYTSPSGYKTRHLDAVMERDPRLLRGPPGCGTWPGGMHVELTGDDVTECLGGADEFVRPPRARYETMCDPRLNARQSLDLAFQVAELR